MKNLSGRNGRKNLPKYVERQQIYPTYHNSIYYTITFLFITKMAAWSLHTPAPAAAERELKWTPAALAYFASNQQMTALHSAALALVWPGVTFTLTACPLQHARTGSRD